MAGSADDVIVAESGSLGRITLNRPATLNALTLGMIQHVAAALRRWADDPAVAAVLLDGAGPRGFCAGGDIKRLYETVPRGDEAFAAQYFREEYTLNAAIGSYAKPIVALMDGIVMGGGVGLSAHASHRIVTERSIISMPEVSIGFFPDVGGTYLLSRAPGELGTHAALTAARLTPADALLCGLADHFIGSDRLDELPLLLHGCRSGEDVHEALRQAASPVPSGTLGEAREWIDACYAEDSVEAILARLDASAAPGAHAAAASIRAHAPTALKVTLRALRSARALGSLPASLNQEYRMALASVRHHDFVEGVRAAVIDKDRQPRWSPARLQDVTEDMVERPFAPLPGGELGLTG